MDYIGSEALAYILDSDIRALYGQHVCKTEVRGSTLVILLNDGTGLKIYMRGTSESIFRSAAAAIEGKLKDREAG